MHDLPLLTTIAAAFAAAWVCGLIAKRIGLSPIVGYLAAGIAIGPHTPGFVGNEAIALQLAELGVILLMFGVGLQFHLRDLVAVRNIAVPGAIGQSVVAAGLGMVVFRLFGWPWTSGLMLGIAMAVASTVVLLRVLMDRNQLNSVHGHVAVGWLIVEDIFTVLVLVLIPVMAPSLGGSGGAHAVVETIDHAGQALGGAPPMDAGSEGLDGAGSGSRALLSIGWALVKLAALVAIVLVAGSKVVPWILVRVARLRSRELFTLTVLVVSIAVAVGSSTIFGASMALGAFLAGMVVAQSPVSHQAAAEILPMRDAFAVLFFVSVGMLFDPSFVVRESWMVAAALGVVLLAKPIAALAIVAALGYSARTALTVAIGLAQIGEFSFILSQVARDHSLMPEEGHHALVAAAMISITINPLLFGRVDAIEAWLRKRPRMWRVLNARGDRRMSELNAQAQRQAENADKPLAVIVGYGPVGRVVDAILRDAGFHTSIIDMNMDTVRELTRSGRTAIYGDATRPEILTQAGLRAARHLVVTLPHSSDRAPLVLAARELNPDAEITVRARYLREKEALRQAGATRMIFEEGEAGIALARSVMERHGVPAEMIQRMQGAVRTLWGLSDEGTPSAASPPRTP